MYDNVLCYIYIVGVTILLSLTVFLNMVAETMPATSDAVPLLGMAINIIINVLFDCCLVTIYIYFSIFLKNKLNVQNVIKTFKAPG